MTWRCLMIAACLLPGAAVAQAVPVRSGEHGSFSRLVFDIPPGLKWSLETDEANRNALLTLGTGRPVLQTEGVFERIDTSRVAALTQDADSGVVRIDLNCACSLEAFVLRDRMLVLDVSDPANDTAVPQHDTAESSLRENFTTVTLDSVPRIGPAFVDDPLLPPLRIEPRLDDAGNEIERRAIADENLGEGLTQRLAQAATQGLLTPALNTPGPKAQADAGDTAPEPNATPTDLAAELETALAGLQTDAADAGQIRIGARKCYSDQALDLASWSSADSVIEAVFLDRHRLFGEFDKVDEAILQNLVQSYLHFGFGAEARALLPLGDLPNRDVLRALSYLLDGSPDPARQFRGQAGCRGAASLWALLDHTEISAAEQIDTNAVLRAFEALPEHLKSYLGPTLASRLTEAKKTETARSLLARLKRQEGETTDQIALGTARLDALDGAVAEAETVLGELARTGGPTGQDALAEAVKLASENDLPIDDELVDLSAAFATELRVTEDGPQMWRTYQEALLSSGRFDEAFERLNNEVDLSDQQKADTWQSSFSALTERASDVEFLKHVLKADSVSTRLLDGQVQLAMVARLLDLGLPGPALQLLQKMPSSTDERKHKMLTARAYLDLSQPEEAEIRLIGLAGDESALMRAEARRMMGDYDYAQLAFEAIGDSEAALESAWLSSDWQSVSASEVPALAEAADLAQTAVGPPPEPSLAAATSLVTASEEARAALRSLLDATGMAETENSQQ